MEEDKLDNLKLGKCNKQYLFDGLAWNFEAAFTRCVIHFEQKSKMKLEHNKVITFLFNL